MERLDVDYSPSREPTAGHGMPGTGAMSDGAPTKRRALTAARKEQNRLAQRAFRKRQKERRQKLKETETHMPSNGPRRLRPLVKRFDSDHRDAPQGTIFKNKEGQDFLDQPLQAASPDHPILHRLPILSHPGSSQEFNDTISFSPVSSLSGDSLISIAADQSHDSTVRGFDEPNEVQVPVTQPPESRAVISTKPARYQKKGQLPFPNVYANLLQFVPTTIFSAILHNALSLNFDLQRLADCGPDYMSPFYRPSASLSSDPAELLQLSTTLDASFINGIPIHLRPTPAQILIPHHASLDLIPLPFLRDGAIMLSAAMPQNFNLWELKIDIYERGGLAIWRQGQSARRAEDAYQPWEMKSWEAAPWFLRKWAMVVGGEQGEFHKQSLGWQLIRDVISSHHIQELDLEDIEPIE